MQYIEENTLENTKREIESIIQNLNSTTACFTGHRSQKLPWGFDEHDGRCVSMKKVLRAEIEKAIHRGYKTFLCGMAIGFDMICAETVIELKKNYKDIKIIGTLPCKNQEILWTKKEKERYRKLINDLDGIRCIYDEYIGSECMLERDRYMVNNSSLMIALFNGLPGGTKMSINYARKQGLEIIIIKP